MRSTSLVVPILFAVVGCSTPVSHSAASFGAKSKKVEPCNEVAAPQDGHLIEIYDIQDLVYEVRDFPAPGVSRKAPGVRQFRLGHHMVPLLRSILSPVATVTRKNDCLIVRATKEEHSTVRGLLKVIRKRLGTVVTLQARLFRTTKDLSAGKLKGQVRGAIHIPPEELEKLLENARKDAKISLITAPQMSVFNGQLSHVSMLNQIAYVQDLEVKIVAGASVVDPVVGTAQTGITFAVRPVVLNEENGIVQLKDAKLVVANSRRKFPKVKKIETPFGQIEDPEIRAYTYHVDVTMKEGDAILVGPLSEPWTKKNAPKIWMILTAHVVNLAKKGKEKDD